MLLIHSGGTVGELVYTLIFTNGHIFHLWRDNAFFRIVQLGHIFAFVGDFRFMTVGEAQAVKRLVGKSFSSVFRTDSIQLDDIISVQYPLFTKTRKPLAYVYGGILIGIRSRCIVDGNGRIELLLAVAQLCRAELDLTHCYLDGVKCSGNKNFFGIRKGCLCDVL